MNESIEFQECGFTNSQIDRLGRELRDVELSKEKLQRLDSFRRSFGAPYTHVRNRMIRTLGLTVTGRPYKSTRSIVEKLRRESVRLTQMQDIAGCRIVVGSSVEQEDLILKIRLVLGEVEIDDRRSKPSHGYRAIHAIYQINGRPVEIQIRSQLQHFWAELSEKLSDVYSPSIKYGGGPEKIRMILDDISDFIGKFEESERAISNLKRMNKKAVRLSGIDWKLHRKYVSNHDNAKKATERLFDVMRRALEEGQFDDFLNSV